MYSTKGRIQEKKIHGHTQNATNPMPDKEFYTEYILNYYNLIVMRHLSKRKENLCLHKGLHKTVHSSSSHNSQKLDSASAWE